MTDILEQLSAHLDQQIASGAITQKEATDSIKSVLHEMGVEVAKVLYPQFPKVLAKRQRSDAAFLRRLRRRWRKPLFLLETLVMYAEEVGSGFNNRYRSAASTTGNFKFEAIVNLHARALLVAKEVLTLLAGGFADGALARWRTLHEIAVMAKFLYDHDQEISKRYLLHAYVAAYAAVKQCRTVGEKAGLGDFTDEEWSRIEEKYNHIRNLYPNEVRGDYWWSRPAIGKDKPTFVDIESRAGLSHWRPRYRWASQHTHANFKPHQTLLGMTGATTPALLAGPSDRGLVDPAHSVAVSLTQVTVALVLLEPVAENIVHTHVLKDLCDKVGQAFLASDRRLARWHERKTGEALRR